ncbi:DUF3992 domain-containing protein [Halobacillus sp. BBL2006]|uniref:DUF3992 domain-containing protein n=1 Tax=Halobacillus sp. BBL2006 TaxID=1543706 RepID=UPI000543FA35|nr:S-Ena type endospore appendage [Halobacillus sp. BBL2006]KHE72972.1 hypothetical protein LD39_01740 [Halobacillus sp. BBL2006]
MSNEYEKYCPDLTTPPGCPDIFPRPPKPPRPPKKLKRPISDEICGNISQSCNGEPVEYWRSISIENLPSGTVSVVNKSDCTMIVNADLDGDGIADINLFIITENGQTKSATLDSISNLEIICEGDGAEKCTGTYCISLHYERFC